MALKPEQYEAIALLALPKEHRPTYEEIAQKLGVHVNTLAYWRKDERFQAELKRVIVRSTIDDLPDLLKAQVRHGIGGNAASAKLVLQTHGLLTDKVEVEAKVDAVTDVKTIEERIKAYKARQSESQKV